MFCAVHLYKVLKQIQNLTQGLNIRQTFACRVSAMGGTLIPAAAPCQTFLKVTVTNPIQQGDLGKFSCKGPTPSACLVTALARTMLLLTYACITCMIYSAYSSSKIFYQKKYWVLPLPPLPSDHFCCRVNLLFLVPELKEPTVFILACSSHQCT